jgi:uncharacterized protein (DUF58 family)
MALTLKSFFKDKPYRANGMLPLPFAAALDRFIKRRYAFSGENRLGRKRIFILPSYFGFIYILTTLIMLIGALNYNNNPAFMLTFLLMSIALVAILHSYRNLTQLSFRSVKTVPSFAGHPVQYWILVDNHGGGQRVAIELSAADQPPVVVNAPADDATTVHLNLPTYKRGKIPFCVVTVETRYPFGLYRAWSYIRIEASCLVYPTPAGTSSRPLPSPNIHGDKESNQLGTDDYLGLRNYHAGDSIKHIHWKAYARGQALLTKQFSLAESDEIWFDWDALQGMDTEARLSQLTRWILDADENNYSYGLIIPGCRYEPSLGEQHKHLCLKALAVYQEQ